MSETSGFGPLPIDLDFADELPPTLDVDAIIRRGLHMRRNRRLLGAGTVGLLGVLGVCAACFAPSSSSGAATASGSPLSTFETSSVVKEHPPAGGQVTALSAKPGVDGSNVSVVVWLSGTESCFGAADLATGVGTSISCATVPTDLSTGNDVIEPPAFVATGDKSGDQPVVGFVRGGVAKVSLVFRGHTYNAPVTSVPGPPTEVGAFVIWLPTAGHSVSSGEFSAITGYDSTGQTVGHAS